MAISAAAAADNGSRSSGTAAQDDAVGFLDFDTHQY
jgi:hypothetical protein